MSVADVWYISTVRGNAKLLIGLSMCVIVAQAYHNDGLKQVPQSLMVSEVGDGNKVVSYNYIDIRKLPTK